MQNYIMSDLAALRLGHRHAAVVPFVSACLLVAPAVFASDVSGCNEVLRYAAYDSVNITTSSSAQTSFKALVVRS